MEAQSKITTVIVDDKDRAREAIKEMLAIYCPELEYGSINRMVEL